MNFSKLMALIVLGVGLAFLPVAFSGDDSNESESETTPETEQYDDVCDYDDDLDCFADCNATEKLE